jgi:hypothetical protein
MARLNPFIERQTNTRERNLGKVLLFCEGHTEKNYFDYFATIVNSNKNKYSHMEIVPLLASGNARRVLNYAEDYLADDTNSKKYSLFEKFLVFDCDDPTDIQLVILDMQKSDTFTLLLTNFVFEIWLLMHFENVESTITKAKTYGKLATALGLEFYGDSEKASEGIIRKIIGNGDDLRRAIRNAQELEQKYKERNLCIEKNIQEMNPYTSVHTIMEQILIEMMRSR